MLKKKNVKGGIVLLKIITNNTNDKLNFNFNLEYETDDGKKSSQNYEYEILPDQFNINYFGNNNIQKGISIYYFSEVLNAFVEKSKIYTENNDNKTNEEAKRKGMEFIENAQSVRDYLKKNYVFNSNDKESKKLLDKYLKLITNRYESFNKHFCGHYRISPVLVLW